MYSRVGTGGELPKCQEIVMSQRKQSNKEYVEKRLHAREREVKGGDAVLSEKKKLKKTSCQQPTRESPIQCFLDMGTKLFCSHPGVSSTGEIYSMLSLFTFLTKATRQELRNRSLPPTPEAEAHSPGVPVQMPKQLQWNPDTTILDITISPV